MDVVVFASASSTDPSYNDAHGRLVRLSAEANKPKRTDQRPTGPAKRLGGDVEFCHFPKSENPRRETSHTARAT